MHNNQIGNNLLYVLSEKKSLKWRKFKLYAEDLCRQIQPSQNNIGEGQEVSSFNTSWGNNIGFSQQLSKSWFARDLSSMAYLDLGGKTGETVVKVAPPLLAELPFFQLTFLLTGARSPEFLDTIKQTINNYPKIDIEVTVQKNWLPETVLIKPESKIVLQKWLEDTSFQGNKLSDYIKMSETPPAWNILEFAGSLESYEQSLKNDQFSGDTTHIKECFDINSLKFKPFDPNTDSLEHDLSLVKIFHYEHLYKYYLFSKINEDMVEVQLDWGKFVIAKQSQIQVLEYNKRAFELRSSLQLPFIFERGLALLSGNPMKFLNTEKSREKRKNICEKTFAFKNVPYEIAQMVAKKLGQKLEEI